MLVEMAMRASGRPLGSSGTMAAVNAASSDAYLSAGGAACAARHSEPCESLFLSRSG